MTTRWYLAQYLSDLERLEPRNVGIVLEHDSDLIMKFRGETSDSRLDGRRIPKFIESHRNYRQWVGYWRRIAESDPKRLLRSCDNPRPGDNYFLRCGGELFTENAVNVEDLMRELFDRLVHEDEQTESTIRPAARVVGLVSEVLPHPLTPLDADVTVTVGHHKSRLRFDYRYVNGATTFIKTMRLGRMTPMSLDRARSAAWQFAEASRASEPEVHGASLVALLEGDGDIADELLTPIEQQAHVIVIDEVEAAAESLKDYLASTH